MSRSTSTSPGCAYHMALELWARSTENGRHARKGWRAALGSAIHAMENALQRSVQDMLAAPEQPCAALAKHFDLDPIIDFSNAIPIWESTVRTGRRPSQHTPHDQTLFQGIAPASSSYFGGIRALAQRNIPVLVEALTQRNLRFPRLLDLGAGTGDYSAAFATARIADHILCVDFPYVTALARPSCPSIRWMKGDIRRLNLSPEPPFHAIWLSNVLHHYNRAVGAALLHRYARYLLADGILLIHEYLLDAPGDQRLAAAMLGLHFALTTDHGRCYSREELLALCRSTGFDHLDFLIALPVSTVIGLRRSGPRRQTST